MEWGFESHGIKTESVKKLSSLIFPDMVYNRCSICHSGEQD